MKITLYLLMLLPLTADGMVHIVARQLSHSGRGTTLHQKTVGRREVMHTRSFYGGIWYQEGKHKGFNDGYEQAHNEAEVEKAKQIYALYQELVQKHSKQSPELFAFLLKKNARTSAKQVKRELVRELQLAQEASRSWFSNSTYWNQEITRLEKEIVRIDEFINSRCAFNSQTSNNEQ